MAAGCDSAAADSGCCAAAGFDQSIFRFNTLIMNLLKPCILNSSQCKLLAFTLLKMGS